MIIEVQITPQPIPDFVPREPFLGLAGARVEFSGLVRELENSQTITALEYEAYASMAERQIRHILVRLSERHECMAVRVIHRVGWVPVGEPAIQVVLWARHRDAAFQTLMSFMDLLKADVPIWKTKSRPAPVLGSPSPKPTPPTQTHPTLSLDEARTAIQSQIQPVDTVETTLANALGFILRVPLQATEDYPPCNRSTRDGYAVLLDDHSKTFRVVDSLSASDWRPRQLKPGETVRVATGTALPCEHLQVLMQETVQEVQEVQDREKHIRPITRDGELNLQRRGGDYRCGDVLAPSGAQIHSGILALLASTGLTRPRVSRRIKILHFTTGDEVAQPGHAPQPGQVRDCNSSLIRGWIKKIPSELWHYHLPEDFERAREAVMTRASQFHQSDLVLISGGASVGATDFAQKLLEWLGFEIVFNRLSLRPGAPMIYGRMKGRTGFGLPGNPLSHLACWHALVDVALSGLAGLAPVEFQEGILGTDVDAGDGRRETLWPAYCQPLNGRLHLTPLRWNCSGDVSCLATTNALLRIPAGTRKFAAGDTIGFLPITP